MQHVQSNERWTEKYRPKALSDILGQYEAVSRLREYLECPYPVAFLFEGETRLGTTAAVMVWSDFADFWCKQGRTPYHKRMATAAQEQFPRMHAKVVKRLEDTKTKLASYFAGDCNEFIERLPDAALISFPPAYKGGYETFKRLVDNVKRDGDLTQIPFAIPSGDDSEPWWVISGNHRVKAAIEAGLGKISLQVTDEALPEDRRKAIQLSHNAIVGEDDPATLKALYESIVDLEAKEYSGLDDKTLALLAKISTEPNPGASLDWTVVHFTFLPNEAVRVKTTLEMAAVAAGAKGVNIAARFADYDKFMDAVSACGQSHGVVNGATSVLILLDMFERHVADLREGFLDERLEPKHAKSVPTVSAMGSVEVPSKTASLLAKVLGASSEGKPFAALDDALTQYLSNR